MISIVRNVALGALFLIPFIPLYVANELYFPFITGKGFAFRILVEVAVVAWAVLAVFDPKYRPKFSWTLVLFGAFVAWMFVVNLFGMNPHKAFWSNFERMDGWVTLIHVFGLFLVAGTMLQAEGYWKRWWMAFVAGSALVALVGLFQIAGFLPINQGGVRVDSTFGNAAYFAAYLLFTIGIAVWLGVEERSRAWLRYALFALAGIQTWLLFLSATRGAILGAIAALIFAAGAWALFSGGKTRKLAAGALAAAVLVIGGFLLIKDSDFVRNDPTLTRLASISLEEGSTRLTLWSMALEGALERPVTGWGQEGFNYIFNMKFRPSLHDQEPWFDRAHNVYVDWLVAGGFPALLLFLALLLSSLYVLLLRREAPLYERVILGALLVGYGVQSLVVFDNLFTYVPLAMLFAMAHASWARPIPKLEALPAVTESDARNGIAATAGVILLVVVWFVNVPNIVGARELVQGIVPTQGGERNLVKLQAAVNSGTFATQEVREQAAQFAVQAPGRQDLTNETKIRAAQFAIDELGKELERAPNDARLFYQLAIVFRTYGDYANAEAAIEAALTLSPNRQLLILEQGAIAWQKGDLAGARAYFEQAHALKPTSQQLTAYAAAGKYITGDIGAGDALLMEAFGTTTVEGNPLMRAYGEAGLHDRLVSVWQARVEREPSVRTHFGLASAYVLAGRVGDAVREIQKTVETYPEAHEQGLMMLRELGAVK